MNSIDEVHLNGFVPCVRCAATAASALSDAALAALVSAAFQASAGSTANASFAVSDGVLGSGVAMCAPASPLE